MPRVASHWISFSEAAQVFAAANVPITAMLRPTKPRLVKVAQLQPRLFEDLEE